MGVMNIWEKFTHEPKLNEVHKDFKTLESDGWCSNSKTLDGLPAYGVEIKLDKGEFDIFDYMPFFVKIKSNPEKDTGYVAHVYADKNNIANIQEWVAKLDISKERIVPLKLPAPISPEPNNEIIKDVGDIKATG